MRAMVGDAIADRFGGGRPNPLKAVLVSSAVGVAAAAATYRLLRSG